MTNISLLESQLAYSFKDKNLLLDALQGLKNPRGKEFERLEFLGDRVLGLTVTHLLYEQFDKESEGDLSRRLASMVSGRGLRHVMTAEMRDFFKDYALAQGNKNLTASKMEDVMEALFGAVYRDGGFLDAFKVIHRLYAASLETQKRNAPPIDAKTELQEWALGRGLPLPDYRIAAKHGKAHEPIFSIILSIKGYPPVAAMGTSKNRAAQTAARIFLEQIRNEGAT